MQCSQDHNRSICTCTYEPCPRKGRCCECIAYHNAQDELPACFFPRAAERTYDRSRAHFLRVAGSGPWKR